MTADIIMGQFLSGLVPDDTVHMITKSGRPTGLCSLHGGGEDSGDEPDGVMVG